MERRQKQLLSVLVCLLVLTVIAGCFAFGAFGSVASAETIVDSQVEERGLMTKISLTIGVENTDVWARVHNDFTLGFSTVEVYLQLFSSLEYTENINQMVFESGKHINDLNINKSEFVYAYISGVQRYWRAQVKYRLDNKDWVVKETDTILISADGRWIS